MKSLFIFIENLPDSIKVIGCLVLSLLLGIVDYITGDYSLSLFYFLPIAIASWFVGKRAGRYIALLCGMQLYILNLLVAPGKVSLVSLASLRSWNSLMEVSYFLLIAYLISIVRTEMDKSRQRSIELEFLNHELSAFNYTVAHDLRSPLVWIGGYCRSILKHHSERLDEKPLEQLREICDGLLRMEQLISDLLDFSKLGQGELNRESVDLSELAKCVGEELMLAEPGRRVTFSIAEGVTSFSDKRLLKVVLENMLRNAWKYTSEQEEAVIEFGITNFKGKRAYFVRDNGDGFDMELAGKLFVPFQRLHDSDRFKGHGIGLATVKRIISRHNGEIWAESRKGKGATFYFKLGR